MSNKFLLVVEEVNQQRETEEHDTEIMAVQAFGEWIADAFSHATKPPSGTRYGVEHNGNVIIHYTVK